MADFGEILKDIGDFGTFQVLLLITVGFPNFIMIFMIANLIFIESDPERHCNTDWILKVGANLSTEEQLNLTLPRGKDGTFSRCRMFVPVDWDIDAIREYGLNETTKCQDGWVYSSQLYQSTTVTDFDLVCGQENMVQVAQTVSLAGVLVGSLLFGPLAESYGRKRAVQIPTIILLVFTTTTALCPNFYLFLVSTFLSQVGSGGFRVNSIILTTEWIGVSKRSWGVCTVQLFTAIGQCALAGVMFLIRNWRLTQLVSVAPLLLVGVYVWFLPESARWLLSRGQTGEARSLLLKAASMNKRPAPPSVLGKVGVDDNVNTTGIKVIFKSSLVTRYFFTLILAWFSLNISVYSLYLDMSSFGMDIFLTQLLFGLCEILGNVLSMWLLEVFGRKVLYICTLTLGGLSTIFVLAVPEGIGVAVATLAILARFFLVWAGAVTCIYMQELVPTSVRQSATAIGSISGRSGGLLAPLVNMLAVYNKVIPLIVVSSITLISAVLGFWLPETRRTELPDTIEDVENKRKGAKALPSVSPLQTTAF